MCTRTKEDGLLHMFAISTKKSIHHTESFGVCDVVANKEVLYHDGLACMVVYDV